MPWLVAPARSVSPGRGDVPEGNSPDHQLIPSAAEIVTTCCLRTQLILQGSTSPAYEAGCVRRRSGTKRRAFPLDRLPLGRGEDSAHEAANQRPDSSRTAPPGQPILQTGYQSRSLERESP